VAQVLSCRNVTQEQNELEVRRIMEGSDELRELEKKLMVAYVNQGRAEQHRERLLMQELDQERELAIEDHMERQRQMFLKAEEDQEVARRAKEKNQQRELQKQIMDRQALSAEAEEDARRDKEMVDAIVQKIIEEDRNKLTLREKKKEETYRLVQQMQEERERNKNELLQQEKDQEAKISAYQNAIMERAKEEQEEKARVDAERKRRWEVVVKETRSQTQSREEFESLRKILWEEELEAREVREETERAARAAKQKEEMMLANQAQLRAKQELIKAQEEEEREMVQTMLIKFAEDEAAALTEHERERAKQVQFVSVIQGQREDKVRRAEAERAREVKEMEQDVEREKYKKTVVAEARKRLLEKHAAKLQGYLPKGVLLDQDEVAHLRKNSFKTFWKDLQKNES